MANRSVRLGPEVNRIIYVKNLPFAITGEELYDLFGKYGAIRQIRLGTARENKGTAFVVYEDIYDAKKALEHLSGFNVGNRYIVVLYYNKTKMEEKRSVQERKREVEKLKQQYALTEEDIKK